MRIRLGTAVPLVVMALLMSHASPALASFIGGGVFVGNDEIDGGAYCINHHMTGTFTGSVVVGNDEVLRVESDAAWEAIPDGDCGLGDPVGPISGSVEDFGITAGSAGDFSLDPQSSSGTFSLTASVLTLDASGLCQHDSRQDACLLHLEATWVPGARGEGGTHQAFVNGALAIFFGF